MKKPVTNIQGTNPIVPGDTYVFHYGNKAIAGELIDTGSRSEVYLKCRVHTNEGYQYRHLIVPRLMVMPLYQFN
jgi:hypothetical protein